MSFCPFWLRSVGGRVAGASVAARRDVSGAFVRGGDGRTDVSSQPGSGIPSGSDTGFGLAYGIGAEYAFNTQLSMVLQYDIHQLHYIGGSGKEEMKVTSLGLRYKF